jgi:hypothetical protein
LAASSVPVNAYEAQAAFSTTQMAEAKVNLQD